MRVVRAKLWLSLLVASILIGVLLFRSGFAPDRTTPAVDLLDESHAHLSSRTDSVEDGASESQDTPASGVREVGSSSASFDLKDSAARLRLRLVDEYRKPIPTGVLNCFYLLKDSRTDAIEYTVDGSSSVIVEVPSGANRLVVHAAAPGFMPREATFDALDALVATATSQDIVLQTVWDRQPDVWGRISVDGLPSVPAGLTIQLVPRETIAKDHRGARTPRVLVDPFRNTYYAFDCFEGSARLTASSRVTGTYATNFESRTGDLLQVDVLLKTGGRLVVRAIDAIRGHPLRDVGVKLTVHQQVDTLDEINGARIFESTQRDETTRGNGEAVFPSVPTSGFGVLELARSKGSAAIRTRNVDMAVVTASDEPVVVPLSDDGTSAYELWGSILFEPPSKVCQVVAEWGRGRHRTVALPDSKGEWAMVPEAWGDARVWLECGGKRVSAIVDARYEGLRTGPVSITEMEVQTRHVSWIGAPLDWKLVWTQSGRILHQEVTTASSGSSSMSLEPNLPITCKLSRGESEFLWLSWTDATFADAGPFDFRAAPVRDVSFCNDATSGLRIRPPTMAGDLLVEVVSPVAPLKMWRIRAPIVAGRAHLSFSIGPERTYYRAIVPKQNACFAGLLDSQTNVTSGPMTLGAEGKWTRLDDIGVGGGSKLRLTRIGNVSLTSTAVPIEFLTFDLLDLLGRSVDGTLNREVALWIADPTALFTQTN